MHVTSVQGRTSIGLAAFQSLICGFTRIKLQPNKRDGPAGPGTAWLDNTFDLVLSSGFLAFASHSGFLKAVSEAEINVGGVMGTSAGALSGSLYSAGYSPKQV